MHVGISLVKAKLRTPSVFLLRMGGAFVARGGDHIIVGVRADTGGRDGVLLDIHVDVAIYIVKHLVL